MVEDIITIMNDELSDQKTSFEQCSESEKGNGSGAFMLKEIILKQVNVTKL
jgi:hypothetical protein